MSGTLAALPTSGDPTSWNDQERALVKAAGLVRTEGRGQAQQEYLADRPTVEAFLMHCQRTGLDPIARQIYAIYRGGKWGIQLSIDGARLVAERSGLYEGQEDAEFSNDGGQTWTTAWMPTRDRPYPTHARVGVFKRGHRQALRAVARWDSYVVTKDEWTGGQKTGNKIVSEMWDKMPDTMLSKVAEMLALRKAFPQDLSGLYSAEEEQAAPRMPAQPQQTAIATPEITRDWGLELSKAETLDETKALYKEAEQLGELGLKVKDGTVMDLFWRRRKELEQPKLVDEPVSAPVARKWTREARLMSTRDEVHALFMEAQAAGVSDGILGEIGAIAQSLPDPDASAPQQAAQWAKPDAEPDNSWIEDPPGSGEYRESGVPAVLQGGDEQ